MEPSNPYAAPATEVRDIVQPGEAQPLADRLTRLGAAILDGLIGAFIMYVPVLVVVGPSRLMESVRTQAFPVLAGVMLLISALVYIGITIHLVNKYGQTMGKRIVGIKVVRKDGSRATLGRIFWLRNVVIGVISAIPIVGIIVALADTLLIFRASRQCLHDQIADTVVITA